MVGALVAVALLVALAGLVVLVARATVRTALPDGRGGWLPARRRAEVAAAIHAARWSAAHDEVDGATRVLLRRSCTGPDGWPLVLEERVFATVPSDDPAWEARFTELMASARYRCDYLNAEEAAG
ncbi:hypothetical protein OF117_09535 [Geodermatophilus sp. YIM 151500]|uniref:hypothetical protein n=1 Tax=Geodermatophilus sp. YIM 151500 TaxID=2984531 RepID=UPI0021E49270|nr:hypothetical protein [Geodermatophilus sp. YIM 151500]MCV2489607.1 hypothetical protein [Geodermatophilus sp. YIM 151500]